jgi:hypothetical protein
MLHVKVVMLLCAGEGNPEGISNLQALYRSISQFNARGNLL